MFRILTLDGGGIKGTFAAAALARLEEQHQIRIIDHFDLIAGTSTGGILAIGLSLNISPAQLLQFYRERGPIIFPSTGTIGRSVGLVRQFILGPKHSQTVLDQEITKILGEARFGDAVTRLTVPAYDAVANRIYIFKTQHAAGLVNDSNLRAADVALATSAAPTYFSAASISNNGRYVDGGVWSNNPSLVALIEAMTFLEVPVEQIRILNIGATTQPFSISANRYGSAVKWNVGLINLMFEAQAEATTAQVKLVLKQNFHRINYQATVGRFSLDDASSTSISDLARLGAVEVERRANYDMFKKYFVDPGKVEPFKPVF